MPTALHRPAYLLAALALVGARDAHAQAPSRNPVVAQALYDEARRLVQAGKYGEACPKFKESYQLDPGGGTMLNLADCYEKQGKTALAWSTFKEALVKAQRDGRDDRIDFANQHLAVLERKLARLTVNVPAEARAPGVTITVDGSPLGEAAWGVAMPVDPGSHAVRAEAPGKRPFATTIDTPSAATARSIDVPPLTDSPGESSGVHQVAASATAPRATSAPSSSRATVGWAVGGLGVASLGVASYFGLHAFARWSDRNDACAAGCSEDAKAAGDDARQAATLSTVGFAVGVAAVAGGAYLVLSSHDNESPTARVRLLPIAFLHGGGLAMRSDW